MSFALYLIGYVVVIIGLAIGAHLMQVLPRWIGVGVLILAGGELLAEWHAHASVIRRRPMR
jgi:MFS superfamily sulfate permease-like transporter